MCANFRISKESDELRSQNYGQKQYQKAHGNDEDHFECAIGYPVVPEIHSQYEILLQNVTKAIRGSWYA